MTLLRQLGTKWNPYLRPQAWKWSSLSTTGSVPVLRSPQLVVVPLGRAQLSTQAAPDIFSNLFGDGVAGAGDSQPTPHGRHFDIAVFGGGSGGMAASQEAARLGLKTIVFDYVEPSPQGSTWDVGGTCVNVGCVPKKLFHSAAMNLSAQRHARHMGWMGDKASDEPLVVDWKALVDSTSKQIHALNFSYRSALLAAGITLIPEHARIAPGGESEPHRIEYSPTGPGMHVDSTNNTTDQMHVTADYVILATGGRPFFPTTIKGSMEHMISSDDIFTLQRSPGRTLCVGGGYVSLECAGILTGLGFEVDGEYCLLSVCD